MWKILQVDQPDTFVLATGRTESVRDFVRMAAHAVGFDLIFEGAAEREFAIDRRSGQKIVQVNPRFYRPAEVELLIGDAGKARRELNWQAATTLEQLCEIMVAADLQRIENGRSF
jgi:GDPmannose 4,6-dehydratase